MCENGTVQICYGRGKLVDCNILDRYQVSGILKCYQGEIKALSDPQRQLLLREGLTDGFMNALEGMGG